MVYHFKGLVNILIRIYLLNTVLLILVLILHLRILSHPIWILNTLIDDCLTLMDSLLFIDERNDCLRVRFNLRVIN